MPTHRFVPLCAALLAITGALIPENSRAETAAYIISDNASGFALESSGADKKLQVGSLTKIATAMVVLDWADAKGSDLGQLATVPESAQALSTNGLDLRPGDRCSLRDLLYAALMQSDNRAAQTLADHVGRALGGGGREISAVDNFVAQMNALARRLNMTHTRFLNAHGLDNMESSLPYSTARDMAALTRYAMSRSAFRFYVSQKERRISTQSPTGEQSQYMLNNTNELLGTNSIDGVKTGTTRKAGPCVIISAARAPESRQEGDNHIITPRRLNIVVLGDQDRFGIATRLLGQGWQRYDSWAAAGRPMKGKF